MRVRRSSLLVWGWAVALLLMVGCADKPKASPQPTSSQIKSDSDRFFDKMKQDEREQGKGVAPAR